MQKIVTINPYSESVIAEYSYLSDAQCRSRIEAAAEMQRQWAKKSLDARALLVNRLAELLEFHEVALAELITEEMGKPILQSRREIKKCAVSTKFFAAEAASIFADLTPLSSNDTVRFPIFWQRAAIQPHAYGVLLGIMPWNFPAWQVMRFAIPAILGGNVVLLKHAPNVSGTAQYLEQLFLEAGFPRGVYADLRIPVEAVSAVIGDRRIRGVSLTGSVRAGRSVAAISGDALKKCVLELGGSDPFVVWNDAPLDATIKAATQARLQNSGQSCIAAKRFLVHCDIFDSFRSGLCESFSKTKIGNPSAENTEVGPLARRDLYQTLIGQRQRLKKLGQTFIAPVNLPSHGYFFEPTIVSQVDHQDASCREELFGPLALLFPVSNIDEVIQLANATDFGLGASIWTEDSAIAQQFIDGCDTGTVFVNCVVQSDARLPFGGVKDSGFGRELGRIGSIEFQNLKTVVWA